MLYLIEKNEFVKTLILILLIFLVSCSGGGSENIDTEPDQESLSIASLEIYIENPIYQDITRSVFFKSNYETDIEKIIFSTLESYKPDGSDHNFLMVSSEFDSSGIKNSETIKIVNSREARNCTSGELLEEYFCGSSLVPQVIKFDVNNFSGELLYRDDTHSGWVHGIAYDRNENLYFIPSSNNYLPEGISKIDRFGNLLSKLPYAKSSSQTYGGIDLIDENGTIWLWKAYPWEQTFLLRDGSEIDRNIDGWSAEGFEKINENIYHIFVNKSGDFDKRKIVDTFSDEKLDNFINVDLQFRMQKQHKVVYFDQSNNNFYIYNKDDDSWSNSILNQFGEPKTEFILGKDKEVPLLWLHPEYGQIQIIGATQNNEVIGWQYGRKSFFLLSEQNLKYEIDIKNLSPSEITALSILDGNLYGAGNLTWSNIFSYSPGDLKIHKETIPNNEGQIDILFNGFDGYIYGMGYPGAKAFKYNPDLAWNPGISLESNPKNCGELDGQTRGIKGFNDSNNTFYLTESDYSAIKITAISRIDINTCSIIKRTDSEDLFPTISDFVNYGDSQLLGIGNIDTSKMLMVIDKDNLNIVNTLNVSGENHTLFTGKNFTKSLIGIDSSVCIINTSLELSSCIEIDHAASKIFELGSYALVFGLKDLTIIDSNLNIMNSYTSSSLGLNEFFPYLSLMHVAVNANEVFFSNYSSVYKIIFNGVN